MNLTPLNPTKIYENDDIEVYHQHYNNDLLIISFNEVGMLPGQGAWGKEAFDKLEFSYLGLVSKYPNWFPNNAFEKVLATIKVLLEKYQHIITYGHSQGGYAALRFAHRLHANTVIAFSPQYAISPEIMQGKDNRFSSYFRQELEQEPIKHQHVPPKTFVAIFYDMLDKMDKENVLLIKTALPSAQLINVAHMGHQTIRLVASSSKFEQLVLACRAQDVAKIRHLIQHYKRNWELRATYLARGIVNDKPKIAMQLLCNNWDKLTAEIAEDLVLGLLHHHENQFVFDNLDKFIATYQNNQSSKDYLMFEILKTLNNQGNFQQLCLQFFLGLWGNTLSLILAEDMIASQLFIECEPWLTKQKQMYQQGNEMFYAIGWYSHEPWGRWSKTPDAYLVVSDRHIKDEHPIIVNVRLLEPTIQILIVAIYQDNQWHEVLIKDNMLILPAFSVYLIIKFSVTTVISPFNLGINNDTRKLGVAVSLARH